MSGYLISIGGAKDASGSSTLAMNLSFLLHKLSKKKVLLVDYDFTYAGDLYRTLKIKESCYLTDLLSFLSKKISNSMFDGFIPSHASGVPVIQGVDINKVDTTIKPERFNEALSLLLKIYDYVICDIGAYWSPYHLLPLQNSSLIYLVTVPEVSALVQAQNKITNLLRSYIPKDRLRVILNKCTNNSINQQDLATRFEGFQTEILPDIGKAMAQSSAQGNPIAIQDVRSPYTLALETIINKDLINNKLKSHPSQTSVASHEAQSLLPFWTSYTTEPDSSPQSIVLETTEKGTEWDITKSKILKRLLQEVDFRGIEVGKRRNKKDDKELRDKATEAILKIINEMDEQSYSSDKRKQLVAEVLDEAIGLGPLEVLLADKSISEIMINGKNQIYIERNGKLVLTPQRFSSEDQLNAIIERIVAPIGRRIDESSPLVDARLSDGSRVNIIIPPLSLIGPSITIRRFSDTPLQVNDLIRFGSLSENMGHFLKAAIEAKLNIIVSGGTGSGKTTLLNVLSSFIPGADRIVTIEDAAELRLNQDHVISLESRPPNIEGKGSITIRALLKNSLRMRPDRIVIGECRGGEALDMLQAMNTGHDGSLTTIHANTPRDCISRLETLVMYSGVQLPSRAIRSQIASAIDLIIQLNRISDGSRKITQITEVTGMEGDIVTLQDIFAFKQQGLDANKKAIGHHSATGFIPRFVESLEKRGIELSRKHFKVTTNN